MAEQREGTITVRSDLHDYMEQIDQYTAQLPLVIREQMRQALYREYESDYEAQESLCREMLEKLPGNSDVLSMLGRCLLSQGRFPEAQQYLEEALDAGDSDQNTVISLAQAYHAQQQYKKAAALLEKIDPPESYHPFFYTVYGDCVENLGQKERAREIFRKEITRWEETREVSSVDILDGCFVRVLYLGALTAAVGLTVDIGVYKRFLTTVEMDAKMQLLSEYSADGAHFPYSLPLSGQGDRGTGLSFGQ